MAVVPGLRRTRVWLVLAIFFALGGAALAATETGVIGPSNKIQPTGRQLDPVGKMTQLGNLPTGGALTTNGRYLWTLSTGRGLNDIRIVQVQPKRRCRRSKHGTKRSRHKKLKRCRKRARRQVGRVVQTIPMPGLSGGIAMAADGRSAYVSGVADSPHKDQQVSADVPGRQGDVIHSFSLNPRSGIATRKTVVGVPPPSDAPTVQDFPPGLDKLSWPRDLAVSPDGKTVLAALNLADRAALIDVPSGKVRYVTVGHYPYGAAITRDGRFGLVTSETEGSVYVIGLDSGKVVKQIQVGPQLSHPESIAIDPVRPRAYVALANQDTIAVIDTGSMSVERTLSVARSAGRGTSPTYLSVTPDGCDLLSADSGEDAVAVFALSAQRGCAGKTPRRHRHRKKKGRGAKPFDLVGRIPTGSYPTVAAATPGRRSLVWVSARGLGVGPNPNGPNPNAPNDNDNAINSFGYLPSIVRGSSGILAFPSDRALRKLTPRADRQIIPTNQQAAPADTPIRAGGPIKHVFYIVKENRTYDQMLGDDPRGDGDPNLSIFGKNITPNLHALAQRFGLLDHVYADSEASIDGHYWTAAGAVSDYVTKAWHQNYAGRGRPYDFGSYEVSAPPQGYIFERMLAEGVSFFNYGEALAGLSPFPDKDRTDAQSLVGAQILSPTNSDIQLNAGCYDSDAAIFQTAAGQAPLDVYDSSPPLGAQPGAHSRFDCFNTHFQAQLATNSVPAFNYVVLPLDHTEGVSPGKRTPNADVANNDYGLGQIVQAISHSSIWPSSMIEVIEDDSQDGADHVDAHRIPALLISPYTQQGAVVHNRYDQLSFLRTAEIVTGLQPRHLAESLSVPLYDAMTATAQNSAPYNAIVPGVDMTATNPNTAANRRASAGLDFKGLDQVTQRRLDSILWHYRHGFDAAVPPAGPNASTADSEERDQAGNEAFTSPAAAVRELRHRIRAWRHHRHG